MSQLCHRGSNNQDCYMQNKKKNNSHPSVTERFMAPVVFDKSNTYRIETSWQ